jgi:hypothetical protein
MIWRTVVGTLRFALAEFEGIATVEQCLEPHRFWCEHLDQPESQRVGNWCEWFEWRVADFTGKVHAEGRNPESRLEAMAAAESWIMAQKEASDGDRITPPDASKARGR